MRDVHDFESRDERFGIRDYLCVDRGNCYVDGRQMHRVVTGEYQRDIQEFFESKYFREMVDRFTD